MTDNFFDEIEFEDSFEQEEDEGTEGNLVSDTFYIQPGQIKLIEPFPLAFTVPDNLSPVILEGFTLAWTKKSLLNFADIQRQIHSKNLPYAPLRGYLEVDIKNAARIESTLGLSKRALNRTNSKYDPEPFVYLDGGSEEEINKTLRPILNDWITKYLKPFAKKEEVSTKIIERLEELQDKNDLLKITPLKSQVLPWIWSPETGTTHHRNQYDYRVLADYIARQIAGQEIFQGLGPIKRIISSNGTFTSGMAELITEPRSLKDTKGKFSLVLRLEVITFPSLHQPLLKVDVSKRRWLTQLKSPRYNSNDISGFIFSQDHSDRAFRYKIHRKEEKKNKNEKKNQENKSKNWTWKTDEDFEVLRRKLQLRLQSFDGQQIALGQASTDSCEVVLTYSNGLQDNSEDDEDSFDEYGIEAGVPEIDKLEALEAIATILQPLGIQVFNGYSSLKFSHNVDDTASRMINLPTLIGGVIELLETKANNLKFTPKYLEQFDA